MTEKTRRIVEGLRYCANCAGESASCEKCRIFDDCRHFVAKMALEVIDELDHELEEYKDSLSDSVRVIAELQEALFRDPSAIPCSNVENS